ncbi:hypothetical protein BJ508DRAFT_359306 [Ascobolus immersus RN42]|uniref:Trypsin-like serine protease n=1 Tax=Ascobolus immersus RN42 TaxID=1160509 RepID=A0A3N4IGH2_ASCIM|nr:hypothetical protein BJ508DRAFT_359306 [Ascobolus immersus RN42]
MQKIKSFFGWGIPPQPEQHSSTNPPPPDDTSSQQEEEHFRFSPQTRHQQPISHSFSRSRNRLDIDIYDADNDSGSSFVAMNEVLLLDKSGGTDTTGHVLLKENLVYAYDSCPAHLQPMLERSVRLVAIFQDADGAESLMQASGTEVERDTILTVSHLFANLSIYGTKLLRIQGVRGAGVHEEDEFWMASHGTRYRLVARSYIVDLAVLQIAQPSQLSNVGWTPMQFEQFDGFGRMYLVGACADVSYKRGTAFYDKDCIPSNHEYKKRKKELRPRELVVVVCAGRVNRGRVEYDGSSLGGMSGGGVYDGKGRYIGTHTGGPPDGRINYSSKNGGISIADPRAKMFLRQHMLPIVPADSNIAKFLK